MLRAACKMSGEGEIYADTYYLLWLSRWQKKKNACMPLKLKIVSKFLLLLMVPAPSSDCIFSCCPLVSSWHTSGWRNLPLTLSPSLYPSPVPDLYLPCGFVDSSFVTSFSRHHPGKPPVFSDVWKKRRHFNSLKCL